MARSKISESAGNVPIVWYKDTAALYTQAINGVLTSPGSGSSVQAQLYVGIWISVTLFHVDQMGNEISMTSDNGWFIFKSFTTYPVTFIAGDNYVLRSAYTGGFIAVFEAGKAGAIYELWPESLILPNHLGAVPEPSAETLIPTDSPTVVVGVARISTSDVTQNTVAVREQYWRRDGTSRSLAPDEDVTITFTSTSGMTSTSTDETETTKQIGTSASAGWGPVSVSVSASLSKSSRSSQQLTLTRQETKFYADQMKNAAEGPVLYLRWQLTDLLTTLDVQFVTEYDDNVQITGRIDVRLDPIIVKGPYVPATNPALTVPDLRKGVTFEEFARNLSRERRGTVPSVGEEGSPTTVRRRRPNR